MASRNQHYIPRFYLRLFGINDKQIAVFNIPRGLYIPKASIGDQCQRHNFYDEDGSVEDGLRNFETTFAPFIKEIVETERVPSNDIAGKGLQSQWVKLLTFVAMQSARTHKQGVKINAMTDGSSRYLMRKEGEWTGNDALVEAADSDRFRYIYNYPVYVSMNAVNDIVYSLHDMDAGLIVSKYDDFLTSDDPVFLYNLYCQPMAFAGVGPLNRGLVIFFPLSPRHVLFIYDPKVFNVKSLNRVIVPTDRDIDQINAVQFISAYRNLYCNGSISPEYFDWLRESYYDLRSEVAVVISEFQRVDETGTPIEYDSMASVRTQLPNLKMNLSFASIKRGALKIPVSRRGDIYRHNQFEINRAKEEGRPIPPTIELPLEPRDPPPGPLTSYSLVGEVKIRIDEM